MIKSFKCKFTQDFWEQGASKKVPSEIRGTALRKLVMLDSAEELKDLLSPPGNRLEALKGDREGQWSIRINEQWRLCFRWNEGAAFEVEIVDYH